jgi:hypothetical protein
VLNPLGDMLEQAIANRVAERVGDVLVVSTGRRNTYLEQKR